ncbi:MAG: ArnT family glycosyltransferase [Flavobacteriales bacterium]
MIGAANKAGIVERGLFVVLVACTFFYVCLRAVHVPFTHDEAVSFFQYARTGAFQPGFAHWDAGNHLLSSAFGHLAYLGFGMSPGAIRTGSVLCYLLYAFYVWRVRSWALNALVRNVIGITLLLTPFLLDFFSLFRGYGPSLAFALMGMYHLVRYSVQRTRPHLVWGVIAFSLAGLASLNILLFWMQALGLFALFAVIHVVPLRTKAMHLSILALLGLPPLGYSIWYGEELKLRNMLYYGSDEGLVKGTLASLSRLVLGSDPWPLLVSIGLLMVLAMTVAFASLNKGAAQDERWMPLRILALCLLGELVGRTLLWELKGVLYPIDRTASHLVLFSLLLFALALDRMAMRTSIIGYAVLVLLVLPMRTMKGLNLERTVLWPEEHFDETLFAAFDERRSRSERPLLVSGWNQYDIPWLYARELAHPELAPVTTEGYPLPQADLVLLSALHTKRPKGYEVIYKSEDTLVQLLERREPLQLELIGDTAISIVDGSGSFFDLWTLPVARAGGRPLIVELTLHLTTMGKDPVFQLVSDAKRADGAAIMYEALDLHRVHQQWNADTLHMVRHFPAITAPDWAKLYLWMINGRALEGDCRIRTYRVSN